MNLARFQLALNHDDPSIVVTGLKQFKDRIIQDHNASLSFGYNGRNFNDSGILTKQPESVCGLLKDYVHSSPQLEELFVLWKLPGRDENTDLVIAHTQCMAALLHCAKSVEKCCTDAVARILSELWKVIVTQLTMSSTSVVHSTLGLLIAMCRSSAQNCRDTYSKLISQCTEIHTLLQRGKAISYQIDSIKVSTDSRYLLVILIFTNILYCEVSSGMEILGHRNLFYRVTSGVLKDPIGNVILICTGISQLLHAETVPLPIKVELLDSSLLQKLLDLPLADVATDYDELPPLINSILKTYTDTLLHATGGKKAVSATVHGHINVLLKQLSPAADMFHRKLVAQILHSRPHLLSRALQAISIPWDQPNLSLSFITALDCICYLLHSVVIEPTLKESARALNGSDVAVEDTERSVKSFVAAVLRNAIPAGASKRDITRILQHQSPLVQRMGTILYLRICQRIESCIKEVQQPGVSKLLQTHLVGSLSNALPDVHCLLSLRNRYFKTFMDYSTRAGPAKRRAEDPDPSGEISSHNHQQLERSCDMEQGDADTTGLEYMTEDGQDENAAGSGSPATSILTQQSVYFTQLIVITFETILRAFPLLICGQYTFDITRLLDDVIPWSTDESPDAAMMSLNALISGASQSHYRDVVIATIKALTIATMQGSCRWFGSRQDCVKALSAALVSKQWENSCKRSALVKLILLTTLATAAITKPEVDMDDSKVRDSSDSDQRQVREAASKLLQSVVVQSELFVGHGVADIEMLAERSSWLHIATQPSSINSHRVAVADGRGNQVLLFELLLRISYHWNVEACIGADTVLTTLHQQCGAYSSVVHDKDYIDVNVIPFSPVMYCALSLSCGNMTLFQAQLPKHIQTRYETIVSVTAPSSTEYKDSVAFFDKFSNGFRKELEIMLTEVVLHSLPWYSSPISFIDVLFATAKHLDTVSALSGGSIVEITAAMVLLYKKNGRMGEQKHVSKRPRTRSNSVSDHQAVTLADLADDSVLESPSKLGLKQVACVARVVSDSAEMLQPGKSLGDGRALQMYWPLIFEVALSHENDAAISSTLDYVTATVKKESTGVTTSPFERKVAVTVYALRVIGLLGRCLDAASSAEGIAEVKPAVIHVTRASKRSKAAVSNDVHMGNEVKIKMQNLVNILTMLVVESIRATGCAPQIATALNVPFVIETFVDRSPIGSSYLHILFAAVVSQYRQMQSHPKKKLEIQHHMDALWTSVCTNLRSIEFSSAFEDDKGLFALCWTIQMVHDDSHLRRTFVSFALQESSVGESRGGFQLTSLTQTQCYSISPEKRLMSWALAPIHSSVLNAAGSDALSHAVRGLYNKYVETLSAGDFAAASTTLQNALCGVVVQTETTDVDGTNSYALSVPSLYCEVLCLVDVSTMATTCDEIVFLASLSRSVESVVLYDAVATPSQSKQQEYDIIFNKLPTFLAVDGLSMDEVCHLLDSQWTHSPVADSARVAISKILHSELADICNSAAQMSGPTRALIKSYMDLLTSPLTSPTALITITALLKSLPRNVVDLLTVVFPCVLRNSFDRVGDDEEIADARANWLDLYECTLLVLVDGIGSTMKIIRSGVGDYKSTQCALNKYACAIMFVISFRLPVCGEKSLVCCNNSVALINKLIKSCLKYGLGDHNVLHLLECIFHSHTISRSTGFEAMSEDGDVEWELNDGTLFEMCAAVIANETAATDIHTILSCQTVLEMLVSHSQFETTLGESDGILKFLLYLLGLVFTDLKQTECDLSEECISFMAKCVMTLYGGSMSLHDRIAMRILFISQQILDMIDESSARTSPSEASSTPRKSVLTYPPHMETHTDSSWVLTVLTPPVVYSTLAAFPTWRALKPQPIEFEHEALLFAYVSDVQSDREIVVEHIGKALQQHQEDMARCHEKPQKFHKKALPANSESIDEDADCDPDDSVSEHTDITAIPTSCVDNLHDTNASVLDPSYWLPCIHLALLRCSDISMRHFANCGGLAFVIASLTSQCLFVRSYAKACLYLVLDLLRRQTPDKDSAFKERPQLLVIVNFIRNAFDNSTSGSRFAVDHLPLTSGIFLGRAALHLLQPQHALFSSMNKYLLSRPYCDMKDVPLYDSLVAEGDVENDAGTRLAALRLLRDCMGSKEDHLNMCRKNAYSRLMVYFVLFGRDVKIAHSILDIMDKALSFAAGARYLLERCAFIPWLQQLASPLNSHHISLQDECSDTTAVPPASRHSGTGVAERREGVGDLPLQAAPPRLLFRVVALLRKAVAALALLESEGVDVLAYLQHAYIAATATIRDILLLHNRSSHHLHDAALPFEFFRQLVLCMWDITLTVSTFDATDMRVAGVQWRPSDIITLGKICLQLYQSNSDSEKVALCLVSLLAFRKSGVMNSPLTPDDWQCAIELILGTSTRQLFHALHQAKKSLDGQSLCLLSPLTYSDDCVAGRKSQHDDQYIPALLAPSAISKVYSCGFNIIFQDCSVSSQVIGPTSAMVKTSCGYRSMHQSSSKGDSFPMDGILGHIMQNNWSLLSEMHFTSTPLPFDLGNQFMLKICLHTVLRFLSHVYHAADLSLSRARRVECTALRSMRWVLLMKKCYVDNALTNGLPSMCDSDIGPEKRYSIAVAARIISIVDSAHVRDCRSSAFMYFSSLFDTALVAACSCAVHLTAVLQCTDDAVKCDGARIASSSGHVGEYLTQIMLRVINVLCGGITPAAHVLNIREVFELVHKSNSTRRKELYEQQTSFGTSRAVTLSLMETCCGVVAHLLTLHDRLHADDSEDGTYMNVLASKCCSDGRGKQKGGDCGIDDLDILLTKCASLDHLIQLLSTSDYSFTPAAGDRLRSDHRSISSTLSLGQPNIWSEKHYMTKHERSLGAFALYENMDYGASAVSVVGGLSYRPRKGRQQSSPEMLLQSMKLAAKESTLLGEAPTERGPLDVDDSNMDHDDDSFIVQEEMGTLERVDDIEGRSVDIHIVRKRPRFHKLTYTPHFSRSKMYYTSPTGDQQKHV